MSQRVATAPLAAAGLIGGYAVAVASGSRPAGGLVLGAFGVWCVVIWLRRDGRRIAALLALTGLLAFALSHVIALVIGAWPAVLLVAAATGGVCWRVSDSRQASSSLLT
jgi:tetrahydromethanopterin S-methyltransferase subunit C